MTKKRALDDIHDPHPRRALDFRSDNVNSAKAQCLPMLQAARLGFETRALEARLGRTLDRAQYH